MSESAFEGDDHLEGAFNEILQDIVEKSSDKGNAENEVTNNEGSIVDADANFDKDAKLVMQEIQDRITELKKKGISTYIIKRLALNTNEKLSRLCITKRYEILILDYFIEVKMTPLPMAVFLLFLNHPEGIYFKALPDYREELMEIYKKIKGRFFNYETAKQSIDDVTNPLSNSINEKCSRIREAFVSQFDDHLARFYYIDGQRGEPKKIALPRNLVEWR